MKGAHLIFTLTILFLQLYIPTSITIYSQTAYSTNFELLDNYNLVSEDYTNFAVLDLTSFFLYKQDLGTSWTSLEISHYYDVRELYLGLFVLSVVSVFVFGKLFSLKRLCMASRNLLFVYLIGILLFYLVDFDSFWRGIHPYLFEGGWEFGPDSISYYLFSHQFFYNVIIFILGTGFLLNLISFFGSWALLRRKL